MATLGGEVRAPDGALTVHEVGACRRCDGLGMVPNAYAQLEICASCSGRGRPAADLPWEEFELARAVSPLLEAGHA